MENNKFTVILVKGKSGSGKTTFATLLENHLNSFEEGSAIVLHNAEQVKAIAKSCFDWDCKKDFKGRQLLVDITSTGYAYDKNLWEKKTLHSYHCIKEICYPNSQYLIIPDWRYKCTEDFFRQVADKVITVSIYNPQREDGTHDSHISETQLHSLVTDVDIENIYLPNTPHHVNLLIKVEEFVQLWLKHQ